LPIAQEVRPGVWAIGAYSGTGNVVGALLGQETAAVLAGVKPSRALFLA
jgi:glycine/D-amino acid oxidase-like deaminating enzyme